jgi:fermentation-respiration switch protein FrsA (DUF1100 family)
VDGDKVMKKRIIIIASSLIGVLLFGLFLAANYFYGVGVKRGTEVELHSEAQVVNANASEADQIILEEAHTWFAEQQPTILEINSYDQLKLMAQYIDQGSKKKVILAHGFGNTSNDMGKLAKFYYDLGFDILLPDARGHGESEGDYIGYGWHDRLDYLEWIDLLIAEHHAEDIILHGNSMGAAVVLMTSGETLPDEVKAIIADSSYSTVEEELAHQLKHIYHLPAFPLLDVTSMFTKIRAGYTFKEASAIEQVKSNTRPLLIIHGDADDLVPTEMGHRIYEAAGGDKELWIVPDVGHTKAFDIVTEEFQDRIRAFITQVIN